MTSTSSSERQDAPASPPPPIGEAAALVARLLGGSETHVAVCEEEPSSIPAPEPAPAAPDPIPTGYPSTSSLTDDSKPAVLPPPNTKAPFRFSRTSLSLIIAAVTVLIFGSGLAVGYGILGQRSKAGSKSTFQQGSPPSILNTAPLEALQNQASASGAANSQPVNPAVNSPYANSPAITRTRSVALSDIGDDKNIQNPSAQPPSRESEQIRAAAEVPHAPARSSPDDSLPPTNPGRNQPASSSASPVTIPLSRRPALESATDLLTTSTLSAIAGATKVPVSSPEVPNQPTASSMGHIDPCQLIYSVQPVYPSEAKRLHVEGDVQLRVVVSVDGVVTSVGLVSGPPLLVPAAIDAARGFRYKPAMLNGKPIETVQTIAMSFNLKN